MKGITLKEFLSTMINLHEIEFFYKGIHFLLDIEVLIKSCKLRHIFCKK